jgi:hypothetical protein
MKTAEIAVTLIDSMGSDLVCNAARTKSDKLIVAAVEAGYYADEGGMIYKPDGAKITGGKTRDGYRNFIPNVVPRNQRSSVLSHRFVAYYFLGAEVFKHALIRHLNGQPADNRISNLVAGSAKENRADIPKDVLSKNAKRNAHLLVARSRKLTDEDVRAMRQVRLDTHASFAKIGKEFDVSTMTAHRAITLTSWSSV